MELNVREFPIDVKKIKLQNIVISSYQKYSRRTGISIEELTLNHKLNDGFVAREIRPGLKLVLYNKERIFSRKIHTILHEIGHIKLKHIKHGKQEGKEEKEAGFFAAQVMAPFIVLYQLHKRGYEINEDFLSTHFLLSGESANMKIENFLKYDPNIKNKHDDDILTRFSDYINENFPCKEWITLECQQDSLNLALLKKITNKFKQDVLGDKEVLERHRFEAIKHFQDNWSISSDDFYVMITRALEKASKSEITYDNNQDMTITLFAKIDPEVVAKMFTSLFDESIDLFERIKSFKNDSSRLLEKYGKELNITQHYQDERTISTYLWLRYPDNYYVYKFTDIESVATILESDLVLKQKQYEDNFKKGMQLYDKICLELNKDYELVSLLRSNLDDSCFPDLKLKTLTCIIGSYIRSKKTNLYPRNSDEISGGNRTKANLKRKPAKQSKKIIPKQEELREIEKLLVSRANHKDQKKIKRFYCLLKDIYGDDYYLCDVLHDTEFPMERINELVELNINYFFKNLEDKIANISKDNPKLVRVFNIVCRYYHLCEKEYETLESIGKYYNLSRERIRQLKNKGIQRMKHIHPDMYTLIVSSACEAIDRNPLGSVGNTLSTFYKRTTSDIWHKLSRSNTLCNKNIHPISWVGHALPAEKLPINAVFCEQCILDHLDQKIILEKSYLDEIFKEEKGEKVNLDDEQRCAIVSDDDSCLIVAGAGTGKTTTIVAKVKYLVERKSITPEEILVISFTRKAVNELQGRINKVLPKKVRVCTFHSFALNLICEYGVNPVVIDEHYAKGLIFNKLVELFYNDNENLRTIYSAFCDYLNIPEEAWKYNSLSDYHKTYNHKQNIQKTKKQRARKLQSLRGEYLRSVQEVHIANFLFENGLEYEYEPVYQERKRIKESIKPYTPDFVVRQGNQEVYLEHYGLVKNDNTSDELTGNGLKGYLKSIEDKRCKHRENDTILLETRYDDINEWDKFRKLKKRLEGAGFTLSKRGEKEIYDKITETSKDQYVTKLLELLHNFIVLYKVNKKDFKKLKDGNNDSRVSAFLGIAESAYAFYQEQLISKNQIDFGDMINYANDYLNDSENQKNLPQYKYIIIDEFQDITYNNFDLIRTLVNKTNAKVIAVGDDWQSIFAFAGSNVNLFTQFSKLMGDGSEMKITRTYRNSQQLIDIAGKFIQKNTNQIQKELKSSKTLENPIVLKEFDDLESKKNENLALALDEVITQIKGDYDKKNIKDPKILLLGRFNFDSDLICESGLFELRTRGKIVRTKFPDEKLILTFLTVHKSKGLGFDEVVIINMFDNKFGFPCQIEDDAIMNLVREKDVSIEFAEERRLFYVAITRTKNRVYILQPKNAPSCFLTEVRELIK